jgi:hypothetical protein
VSGGRIEEGEDGIQVAVRRRANRATERARLTPARGQRRSAPDAPQRLLCSLPRANRLAGQRKEAPDPAQRRRVERWERDERVRPALDCRAQGRHQQRVTPDAFRVARVDRWSGRLRLVRHGPRPPRRMQAQQAAAQPAQAHRVRRAQRGIEEGRRSVGVNLLGARRET